MVSILYTLTSVDLAQYEISHAKVAISGKGGTDEYYDTVNSRYLDLGYLK